MPIPDRRLDQPTTLAPHPVAVKRTAVAGRWTGTELAVHDEPGSAAQHLDLTGTAVAACPRAVTGTAVTTRRISIGVVAHIPDGRLDLPTSAAARPAAVTGTTVGGCRIGIGGRGAHP